MGSEIKRYTFGYVDLSAEDNGAHELQMIPAKFGEAVKYADHQRIVGELEAALRKIADHRTQLPWRACANIAREALNGE
jgi:hypothetical protein